MTQPAPKHQPGDANMDTATINPPQLAYLWAAHCYEAGSPATVYALTGTDQAPNRRQPALHPTGIPYADTMFSCWSLLGSVDGAAYQTDYDETCVEMADGSQWTAREVARCDAYRPTPTTS